MQQELIHRLQVPIDQLPQQFHQLSAEVLQYKPRPDKWSKQEILGHLIDSALYNLMRFTRLRHQESPYQLEAYPQDNLVIANAYQQQDIGHLLALWQQLNRQILQVWRSYTPAELEKIVVNHDGQQGSLTWWMDDYVQHLEHHRTQIFGEER